MRAFVTRTLASVLAALLAVSCGTVRESRQPDIEGDLFLPRAPRVVASPVLEELELRRAIEAVLPYVNVEETLGRAAARNLSEKFFDAAEVPKGVRQDFWRQFEQYKATLSN